MGNESSVATQDMEQISSIFTTKYIPKQQSLYLVSGFIKQNYQPKIPTVIVEICNDYCHDSHLQIESAKTNKSKYNTFMIGSDDNEEHIYEGMDSNSRIYSTSNLTKITVIGDMSGDIEIDDELVTPTLVLNVFGDLNVSSRRGIRIEQGGYIYIQCNNLKTDSYCHIETTEPLDNSAIDYKRIKREIKSMSQSMESNAYGTVLINCKNDCNLGSYNHIDSGNIKIYCKSFSVSNHSTISAFRNNLEIYAEDKVLVKNHCCLNSMNKIIIHGSEYEQCRCTSLRGSKQIKCKSQKVFR